MGYRILYIDPVGRDDVYQSALYKYINKFRSAHTTELAVRFLDSTPMDLEYRMFQALIGPDMVRMLKKAQQEGFDAVIDGCFHDPYLDELREISADMVVVGPAESSVRLAASLGKQFSVIVAGAKCIPQMRENMYRMGCHDYLASFRSLGLGVEDQLHTNISVHLKREIRAALEQDGAEVIILGCTLQMGYFQTLQKTFGVPIIDPSVAALKYAEYLLELRDLCGWETSRVGDYRPPPEGRYESWQLSAKYGF